MQTPPTHINPIVIVDQEHVFTTSLLVAEKFDKLHKNVLRDIEAIIKKCPDKEFSRLNFEPRNYRYMTGKNQEREAVMYEMTRSAPPASIAARLAA